MLQRLAETLAVVFIILAAAFIGMAAAKDGHSEASAPPVVATYEEPTVAPTIAPVISTPASEQPAQAVAQEAIAEAANTTGQNPSTDVQNEVSGINAMGDVTVNIVTNADSAAAANVDANAALQQDQATQQEYAPGDTPALSPIVADVSHNCQNLPQGKFLVTDASDLGPIHGIEGGTPLFGKDFVSTYQAPQACAFGRSAIEWCGSMVHPQTGQETDMMLMFPSVFGVSVFVQPASGTCPSG